MKTRSAFLSLPFQLSNLLIFVILLIFHLLQNFQEAVNFCLGLARFIFVPGDLSLQLLYSVTHLRTSSGFQCCLVCLQRKVFKFYQIYIQEQTMEREIYINFNMVLSILIRYYINSNSIRYACIQWTNHVCMYVSMYVCIYINFNKVLSGI